jgi:dUTP pyrophosphatase
MESKLSEDTIYFSKIKDDAIIPCGRDEDGWLDIYACFEKEKMVIPPFSTRLIPTGIATAFSPNYRVGLFPRGSNIKMNTILSAGRIDSGYRGEYFVPLVNTSYKWVEIVKGISEVKKSLFKIKYPYCKAICQMGVEIKPKLKSKEIPYSELLNFTSERMMGKMGSTDKKKKDIIDGQISLI